MHRRGGEGRHNGMGIWVVMMVAFKLNIDPVSQMSDNHTKIHDHNFNWCRKRKCRDNTERRHIVLLSEETRNELAKYYFFVSRLKCCAINFSSIKL
jgi:hypothetical protein